MILGTLAKTIGKSIITAATLSAGLHFADDKAKTEKVLVKHQPIVSAFLSKLMDEEEVAIITAIHRRYCYGIPYYQETIGIGYFEKTPKYWELEEIEINEKFQKQGVGSTILRVFELLKKPKKLCAMSVESAEGFYTKKGFKKEIWLMQEEDCLRIAQTEEQKKDIQEAFRKRRKDMQKEVGGWMCKECIKNS